MRDSTTASRTLAQWYCLLFGATLLVVGILGFLADSSFDTGGSVEGDEFLVFEVNGWHNLVHVASGIVLLAAANTRPTAKTVAIGFGFVYAIVTIWGLIDGDTVLAFIPVNGADNVLHLIISALGIGLGLASPTTKRGQLRRKRRGVEPTEREVEGTPPPTKRDAAAGTEQSGRFEGEGASGDVAAENDVKRTRS